MTLSVKQRALKNVKEESDSYLYVFCVPAYIISVAMPTKRTTKFPLEAHHAQLTFSRLKSLSAIEPLELGNTLLDGGLEGGGDGVGSEVNVGEGGAEHLHGLR